MITPPSGVSFVPDILERSEIRQMLARSVDALIVASCSLASDALLAANDEVPVILLDRG
jgi:hypothetical protein